MNPTSAKTKKSHNKDAAKSINLRELGVNNKHDKVQRTDCRVNVIIAVIKGDLKNSGPTGLFVTQNWYLPALVSDLRERRNQTRRTWGTVNE